MIFMYYYTYANLLTLITFSFLTYSTFMNETQNDLALNVLLQTSYSTLLLGNIVFWFLNNVDLYTSIFWIDDKPPRIITHPFDFFIHQILLTIQTLLPLFLVWYEVLLDAFAFQLEYCWTSSIIGVIYAFTNIVLRVYNINAMADY